MSDDNPDVSTVAVPGITGNDPDPTPPPAAEPTTSIESMSDTDLEALEQRIAQTRANRPASIAEQIAALRNDIAGTTAGVHQAAARRQEAKGETAELATKLDELTGKLRRFEIAEAAQAAGFKAPAAVADYLAGRDGDVTELVKQAAASGAWAMATPPAPSASVGDGSTTGRSTGQRDAGVEGLMREIAKAQGRG